MEQELHEYNLICQKCGKPYQLKLTEKDFESGKFRKHCSRSCANSRVRTDEVKRKISRSIKSHIKSHGRWGIMLPIHNKCFNCIHNVDCEYKTSGDDNLCTYEQIIEIFTCRICGKRFTLNDIRNIKSHKFCSKECLEKWRHEFQGGYREGSGRSKSGWYKGIFCGSTWELAFLIYHLDHNLNITRCDEKREYIFEEKRHTYIPDFITDKGVIEIKGYRTEQWKAKLESNPDVIVLYENDIKPYLDYVYEQYGFDLVSLYDKTNPKYDKSKLKFRWIHKEGKNTCVKQEKLQEYLDNGYKLGRIKKQIKNQMP